MYDKIKLYRRRFIPDEKILLNDKIVYLDNKKIITEWVPFRPNKSFVRGCSCVYMNEGFKVSKLFDEKDNFLFTYCDIINAVVNGDEYVIEDLLVDVVIEDNSFVKVVDLDELADAVDNNLISCNMAKKALRQADNLLKKIYDGVSFGHYIDF